jgi:catechol 2,3-dioxygenase-like lactoylglutathione lyase family enzyme
MSSNSPSLPAQPAPEDRSSRAYAYVVVSVGDMEEALGLWVGRFGMEVLRRKTGDDPGLARVWGLPKGAIEDQALLNTPGLLDGGLHLVKFEAPGAPVREGAAPTDLVPKSIDVAVREIEARYAEMTALGYRFRSEVHELEAKGMKFHEVHMAGPEGLNLVLLEIPSEPYVVSPQGYGVAPQIVLTTADNAREVAFFEKLLGLERLSHNRLSGPEIERAVGLPPGAVLDITILGARESRFGRLELVQYEGVQSRNLYPRAVPPARGMLSVTYVAPDLAPILERGRSLGIRDHGVVESILGKGRMASVWSPAGLRVDVIEQ